MTNKEKYRSLCLLESKIPLFSKDWWLDAVCGRDNWDVIILERDVEIVAAMPYHIMKGKIIMPMLTQSFTIWIKYPEGQKYATKLSFEKEIYTEIIKLLPKVNVFQQYFHYSITNWLPFYWKGFQQTTRYTYVIENLDDKQKNYENLNSNIRKEIRKAKKTVICYDSDDIMKFYEINKMTFTRQKMEIPYSYESLLQIDKQCSNRNCRKILFAEDNQKRIHAAIYIVWDEQSAYYLMGGGHPELRNSGATSLLMWEAIQFASTVTKKFDFEGSMIEPVERFFRAFGAIQKPYFVISKFSKKIRAYHAVKEILKFCFN